MLGSTGTMVCEAPTVNFWGLDSPQQGSLPLMPGSIEVTSQPGSRNDHSESQKSPFADH